MTQCTINDFQVESNAGIKHRMAFLFLAASRWKHFGSISSEIGQSASYFTTATFPSKQQPKTFVGFGFVAWDNVPCNGKHDFRGLKDNSKNAWRAE